MPTRPRPNRGTRPYHRSGEHVVAKAVPFLVERVKDPRVADDALSFANTSSARQVVDLSRTVRKLIPCSGSGRALVVP